MQSDEALQQDKPKTINDYADLIETLARVEYSRLNTSQHLIEYSELVNIAAVAVHVVLTTHKGQEFNTSYMSTAAKWAIRNELRRRYKWYSHKTKKEENPNASELDRNAIREAVYETIVSVDELAEAENPTQLKDTSLTPEENSEFAELSRAVRAAIKKLPPREKVILEKRFFENKKIKEIATEINISPSRTSRVIQVGLDKVKKELVKMNIFDSYGFRTEEA